MKEDTTLPSRKFELGQSVWARLGENSDAFARVTGYEDGRCGYRSSLQAKVIYYDGWFYHIRIGSHESMVVREDQLQNLDEAKAKEIMDA